MIFLDDDIAIWHREHPGQFEEWLNSWKDMVYHTALGMLLQQQDAEDVTQEVFLRLYHHCYELKDTTSISTWLYRVTINKCIDVIRKRKRQNKWWIFAKADETEGTELDLQHPGVQTERKEHAKVLFNALSKLPEEQRAVFVLHKMEDVKVKDIAKILRKSEKAVESLMTRAQQNLRKQLQSYYEQHFK